MAVETTDLFARSIVDRKRQVRAEFTQNLARLLDEKEMKQSQLAAGINEVFEQDGVLATSPKAKSKYRKVEPWELSRWARGQITPDSVALGAIAKVLGVQPEDLVHGITADEDPNAVVSSYRQIGERYFWEFKGTVDRETHRKLMVVLADAD